jgi:hypothetical protein
MTHISGQPHTGMNERLAESSVAAARRLFQKHWRRAALLAGAADQLEILAKITAWAAAAYALLILIAHLRGWGWMWWAAAMVFFAVALAWRLKSARGEHQRLRKVAVLGTAMLLAMLTGSGSWWVAAFCAVGAIGALYRWPRRGELAARIDAEANWPSTATVAVSLLRHAPASADPTSLGFQRHMYWHAGNAMAKLNASVLLRANDLGRRWAQALLLVLVVGLCRVMLPSPLTVHRPMRAADRSGIAMTHRLAANAEFVTPPPKADEHLPQGRRAGGLSSPMPGSRRANSAGTGRSLSKPNAAVRATAQKSRTASQLRANMHIASKAEAELASAAANMGPHASLNRQIAARLLRAWQRLKPVKAEKLAAARVGRDLTASATGNNPPLLGAIRRELTHFLQRNQMQMQSLQISDDGNHSKSGHTSPAGHAPSRGIPQNGKANYRQPEVPLRNTHRTRQGEHLTTAPFSGAVPGGHTRYTATGVRIYTYDVPQRNNGKESPRKLWRKALRAFAPQTGYIPHRYRAIIRKYFSNKQSAH